jgi:hypothetical protein
MDTSETGGENRIREIPHDSGGTTPTRTLVAFHSQGLLASDRSVEHQGSIHVSSVARTILATFLTRLVFEPDGQSIDHDHNKIVTIGVARPRSLARPPTGIGRGSEPVQERPVLIWGRKRRHDHRFSARNPLPGRRARSLPDAEPRGQLLGRRDARLPCASPDAVPRAAPKRRSSLTTSAWGCAGDVSR